ncbi:MAG: restriction endonuclease subunit S [Pyrinomonadaceae bacterium]
MSSWPDFEVPTSWRVIEVRETAAVMKAGGTPSRKQVRYWDGGDIPFVIIEDMTAVGLYVDHTSERITKEGLDASSAWIVPPGAVLLSMYATIGATAVNRIPLATNQAILAIVPRNDVSAEFLAFCLRAHKGALSARNVQATQKNINKGIVETFPLPIPPLPEQRKIASVLGLVQRAIEQQERLLQLTAELKKTLLHQLFTAGLRSEPQKQTEIGLMPQSWNPTR